MSSFEVLRGDVVFEAITGKANAGIDELRRNAQQAYGGISTEALKAAQIQEKYDKAIARAGSNSTKVRSAVVSYRRELAALNTQTVRTGAGVNTLTRDVERFGRGALVGTGALHGLGRAAAFASTTFLGGAGLIYTLRQVVERQAQVQEETEKTGVVFGHNAADVQRWAGTLSASFGVSEAAALKAAGTFGNMLIPLHFGEGAAATMSKRLVELAADMASFNNASPETVLQAIASGLAGQVRPLRQYGVFLSQARIQEEALADGIAKRGEKLTTQQKVQAAYNIILKDTKNAQGDVARNTESLSVAWSKLTAAVSDTESGNNKLLKSTVDLTNRAAVWLGDTKNQERIQRDANAVLTDAEKIIHGLVAAEKLIAPPIHLAIRAMGGLEHAAEIAFILALAAKAKRGATAVGLIKASSAVARTAIVADAAIEEKALAGVAAEAKLAADAVAGVGVAGVAAGAGAGAARGGVTAAEAGALAALAARGGGFAKGVGGKALGFAGKGLTIAAYIELLNGFLQKQQPSESTFSGGGLKYALTHPLKDIESVGTALAALAGLAKPPPGSRGPATLTFTSVYPALAAHTLTPAAVRQLKDRFSNETDYNAILAIAESQAKASPRRRGGVVPAAAAGAAQAPGYLTAGQQRAQALAENPDDLAALRAQRDYDDRAITFLKKRFAAGKIESPAYIAQLEALEADRNSQQSAIDQITDDANRKRAAAAKKAATAAEKRRSEIASIAQQALKGVGPLGISEAKQESIAKQVLRDQAAKAKRALDLRDAILSNDLERARLAETEAGTNTGALAKAHRAEIAAEVAILHEQQRQGKRLTGLAREENIAEQLATRQALAQLRQQKPPASQAGAEERQFLSSFREIVKSYAPNAFPVDVAGALKQTATHAYEMKHELRRQTQALTERTSFDAFPASRHAHVAASAVTG